MTALVACGSPRRHSPHADCVGIPLPTLPSVPLDDDTARELSRAAANVKTWTAKRNDAIKLAHAAGGGVREIARATGLNVATVHNILFPKRRGGSSDKPSG